MGLSAVEPVKHPQQLARSVTWLRRVIYIIVAAWRHLTHCCGHYFNSIPHILHRRRRPLRRAIQYYRTLVSLSFPLSVCLTLARLRDRERDLRQDKTIFRERALLLWRHVSSIIIFCRLLLLLFDSFFTISSGAFVCPISEPIPYSHSEQVDRPCPCLFSTIADHNNNPIIIPWPSMHGIKERAA